MGRKKNTAAKEPDNSLPKFRPFCYYCDKDFEDERVLIQHQKVKHFHCLVCQRKLDTAAGLQVHMLQVHKENLSKVPSAIKGRDEFELRVHGMDNVPSEMIRAKAKGTDLEAYLNGGSIYPTQVVTPRDPVHPAVGMGKGPTTGFPPLGVPHAHPYRPPFQKGAPSFPPFGKGKGFFDGGMWGGVGFPGKGGGYEMAGNGKGYQEGKGIGKGVQIPPSTDAQPAASAAGEHETEHSSELPPMPDEVATRGPPQGALPPMPGQASQAPPTEAVGGAPPMPGLPGLQREKPQLGATVHFDADYEISPEEKRANVARYGYVR